MGISERRTEKNKAAAVVACTTLARQLEDFRYHKVNVEEVRARTLAENPNAPLWMQLGASEILGAVPLAFDISSLAFLCERGSSKAIRALVEAEESYRHLLALRVRYGEVARSLNDKLNVIRVGRWASLTEEELKDQLGHGIAGLMLAVTEAILIHLDQDEAKFINANSVLRDELRAIFGEEFVSGI